MKQEMTVNGRKYGVLRLLGKGKGGYSYLVERDGHTYVLKQIHHEPCDYYQFGDKFQSELRDYRRLKTIGISVPTLLDADEAQERILKEYIDGDTIYDLVLRDEMKDAYLDQMKTMCEKLYSANTNIDYFPTNFVVQGGNLFYIDFECNDYTEQWDFAHWGVKYWSKTPDFLACAREKGDLPGRKIMILSFDDGTIYDRQFVEMLDRHGIPCTFNLNSGLHDFVWHCGEHPIYRLNLAEERGLYRNHEVASHTVHHPYLTQLPEEDLVWQVEEDCRRLRETFGVEEIGFAVPFDQCGEREISILREKTSVRYVRLPAIQKEFAPPADPWHICVNGLYNEPGIREKIQAFADSTLPDAVFVLCGHSYEFEVENQWEYMDELLGWIRTLGGVECMTMLDYVRQTFPN